jgi:hypothetical protein
MALEGIGSTPAFGAVVRKPQIRCGPGTGLDFVPPVSLELGPDAQRRRGGGFIQREPDHVANRQPS